MLQNLSDVIQLVFGGDRPTPSIGLLQVAARGVAAYAVGLTLIRIGKSRVLSRITPIDTVLGFLLGSLLSRCVTGGAGLSETFVASAVLIGMHWLMTRLAYESHFLGNLAKGNAYQLVDRGVINWAAMRRAHLSENDLRELMRLQAGIDDLQRVKAAYKERNGEVGFVKEPCIRVVEVGIEEGVKTIRIEVAS